MTNTHGRMPNVAEVCADEAQMLALSITRFIAAGYMTQDVACWDAGRQCAEEVLGPAHAPRGRRSREPRHDRRATGRRMPFRLARSHGNTDGWLGMDIAPRMVRSTRANAASPRVRPLRAEPPPHRHRHRAQAPDCERPRADPRGREWFAPGASSRRSPCGDSATRSAPALAHP